MRRTQERAEPAPGFDTGRAPFPDLEAFQGEDAPFFFGRQVETLRALQRFGPTPQATYHRWLQVEGASGTGKSSLVRAGLLPAIERGWLGEYEQRGKTTTWHIAAPLRPGADPIENLATALGNLFDTDIQALDMRLRDKTDTDARALRLLLRETSFVPSGQGLELVVDQRVARMKRSGIRDLATASLSTVAKPGFRCAASRLRPGSLPIGAHGTGVLRRCRLRRAPRGRTWIPLCCIQATSCTR